MMISFSREWRVVGIGLSQRHGGWKLDLSPCYGLRFPLDCENSPTSQKSPCLSSCPTSCKAGSIGHLTMEWGARGSSRGSHQLCTSCTEGVLSTRSGSRLISFMMLARRTGSSCLRKVNEVFSQALLDPGGRGKDEPKSYKALEPEDL